MTRTDEDRIVAEIRALRRDVEILKRHSHARQQIEREYVTPEEP